MEKKVQIAVRQQVTSGDLNNSQLYAEAAIDRIVADGIDPGLRFTGFNAAAASGAAGATQVAVSMGAIYYGGKVYAAPDVTTIDLLDLIPSYAAKILTIVAYGSEVNTDTVPRTFLIDATARTTQAKATSTTITRLATVDVVDSKESTNPAPGALLANQIALAYVLVGPTGIQTITRANDNVLPSVRKNADAIADLNLWRALTGQAIDTIKTDITGLAAGLRNTATRESVAEVARDLSVLKQKAGLPDIYSSFGFDPLLALAQSDTDDTLVTGQATNPLIVCLVEEGIRFAPIQSAQAEMELLNINDPTISRTNNMVMPAYTDVVRISSVGNDDKLSLSQYENQQVNYIQKTVSRTRTRVGTAFTVCTNSAFWNSGQYDPISGIFKMPNGETFKAETDINASVAVFNAGEGYHPYIRLQQFWTDNVDESYWSANVVESSINGAMVAQTFLNSQESIYTSVGLYFVQKGAAAINLLICECLDDGSPNINAVIATTVIDPATILIYPLETKVVIPPTLLERGVRYALVPVTTGAHFVAMTEGNKYAQGSLFTSTDGAFFAGDLTKDIAFQLYAASFSTPRLEVQLNPLTLQGGINSIDIINDTIIPSGCSISYAVKINNVWDVFDPGTASLLAGLPALLQFKAILSGTTDLMPALGLAPRSFVTTSRPRTDFTHVTDAISPQGAPSKTIQVDIRLEAWDPAHHTHVCTILSGAGYGTQTSAASYTDTVPPDNPPETVVRRYVFTFSPGITSFKIQTKGTTDSAQNTYHTASRQFVTFTT